MTALFPLEPDVLDAAPDGGNPRYCTTGGGRNNPDLTLLEWLYAFGKARSSYRHQGWFILGSEDVESAGRALRLTEQTTREEIRQVSRRGSLEVVLDGDGSVRWRFTDLGLERLAQIQSMR